MIDHHIKDLPAGMAVDASSQQTSIDRHINQELDDFIGTARLAHLLMSPCVFFAVACAISGEPTGFGAAAIFLLLAWFCQREGKFAEANIRHRDACSRIRADTANREATDLEIELHKRCSEHAALYRNCLLQNQIIQTLTDAGTDPAGAYEDEAPAGEVIYLNGANRRFDS